MSAGIDMNQENLLIAAYSLAVVASSLFGGWLPSLFHLTHVRMQLVLSFVGGDDVGRRCFAYAAA